MNDVGILGYDAKKVISDQATILDRQGTYSQATASRILRTHLSIAPHSFNALSSIVRKKPSESIETYPSLLREGITHLLDKIDRTVHKYVSVKSRVQ